MASQQDHYEVLQVHPSAHPDVIQSAYRRLALLYHPDTNPAPEAVEMMARLNEAYEVLRDPERRAAYDRQRGIPKNDRASGEGESVNAASSVRKPDKRGRESAQGPVRIPFGHALDSAVAILKWQIRFFGLPISVIAGTISLVGSAPLVLISPFTLPLAIISFFWIWFLGSAVLYFSWRLIGQGFAYLKSVYRRRRRTGDRRYASAGGATQGFSKGPTSVKARPSWKELLPHLAVLGRSAGRVLLRLVGFFGRPISIAAAAITLLFFAFYLSMNGDAGGLALLDNGGGFIVGAVRLLILVIGAPVFVMAAFLIWLFFAAVLLMMWNCLKPKNEKPS